MNSRKAWIAGWCLLSVALITVTAWSGRYMMYPDGISYLDMANKLGRGDMSPLLNAYWSPLYPCLLAVALQVAPSMDVQFQAAHFVNWLIGVGAVGSFTFFLLSYVREEEELAGFRVRTAFGYALFLWAALESVGLAGVGADLCVMALVFLAAGFCCRLQSAASWRDAVLLGLVLSLASFSKAAMIPLSVTLLLLMGLSRRVVLASLAVLAALVGPYVIALSLQQHHFTFGDSGKLNYAWHVLKEAPQSAGWRGAGAVHAPRLLAGEPVVIEFGGPVEATNALWYDPVYFHDGLKTPFDLRKQVVAVARSLFAMRQAMGTVMLPLLAGLIALWAVGRPRGLTKSTLFWWAVAAFGLYSLVVIESRYVAGFLVLFWYLAYDGFRSSWSRGVVCATALCVVLFQVQGVAKIAGDSKGRALAASHLAAARGLAGLGLKAGDRVATVGSGFEAYYAELAGLRVTANIGYRGGPDPVENGFQRMDEGALAVVEEKLRPFGIRAVVGPCGYVNLDARWIRLAGSDFCARMF